MSLSSIVVGIRVRPFNQRELKFNSKCIVEMYDPGIVQVRNVIDGSTTFSHEKPREFVYDHVFWTHTREQFPLSLDSSAAAEDGRYKIGSSPSAATPRVATTTLPGTISPFADQAAVFNTIGTQILQNVYQGFHSCLFAYGQTGSGKTYSMMGTPSDPGILPRLSSSLFQYVVDRFQQQVISSVEVSFCEIYNEKIRDLAVMVKGTAGKGKAAATTTTTELQLRQHPKLGVFVQGLSKHMLSNAEEFISMLEKSLANRSTASTNMNATSSRSHAVVQVTLVQNSTQKQLSGRMSLIDLAGSERLQTTGATGEVAKEGKNINLSLSTLGLCLSHLADKVEGKEGKHIPYRDSTLTFLLSDSLGGNCKTAMLANISPSSLNLEETISTLTFASIAKRVKTKAVVNENPQHKLIRELREELEQLKKKLQDLQQQQESLPGSSLDDRHTSCAATVSTPPILITNDDVQRDDTTDDDGGDQAANELTADKQQQQNLKNDIAMDEALILETEQSMQWIDECTERERRESKPASGQEEEAPLSPSLLSSTTALSGANHPQQQRSPNGEKYELIDEPHHHRADQLTSSSFFLRSSPEKPAPPRVLVSLLSTPPRSLNVSVDISTVAPVEVRSLTENLEEAGQYGRSDEDTTGRRQPESHLVLNWKSPYLINLTPQIESPNVVVTVFEGENTLIVEEHTHLVLLYDALFEQVVAFVENVKCPQNSIGKTTSFSQSGPSINSSFLGHSGVHPVFINGIPLEEGGDGQLLRHNDRIVCGATAAFRFAHLASECGEFQRDPIYNLEHLDLLQRYDRARLCESRVKDAQNIAKAFYRGLLNGSDELSHPSPVPSGRASFSDPLRMNRVSGSTPRSSIPFLAALNADAVNATKCVFSLEAELAYDFPLQVAVMDTVGSERRQAYEEALAEKKRNLDAQEDEIQRLRGELAKSRSVSFTPMRPVRHLRVATNRSSVPLSMTVSAAVWKSGGGGESGSDDNEGDGQLRIRSKLSASASGFSNRRYRSTLQPERVNNNSFSPFPKPFLFSPSPQQTVRQSVGKIERSTPPNERNRLKESTLRIVGEEAQAEIDEALLEKIVKVESQWLQKRNALWTFHPFGLEDAVDAEMWHAFESSPPFLGQWNLEVERVAQLVFSQDLCKPTPIWATHFFAASRRFLYFFKTMSQSERLAKSLYIPGSILSKEIRVEDGKYTFQIQCAFPRKPSHVQPRKTTSRHGYGDSASIQPAFILGFLSAEEALSWRDWIFHFSLPPAQPLSVLKRTVEERANAIKSALVLEEHSGQLLLRSSGSICRMKPLSNVEECEICRGKLGGTSLFSSAMMALVRKKHQCHHCGRIICIKCKFMNDAGQIVCSNCKLLKNRHSGSRIDGAAAVSVFPSPTGLSQHHSPPSSPSTIFLRRQNYFVMEASTLLDDGAFMVEDFIARIGCQSKETTFRVDLLLHRAHTSISEEMSAVFRRNSMIVDSYALELILKDGSSASLSFRTSVEREQCFESLLLMLSGVRPCVHLPSVVERSDFIVRRSEGETCLLQGTCLEQIETRFWMGSVVENATPPFHLAPSRAIDVFVFSAPQHLRETVWAPSILPRILTILAEVPIERSGKNSSVCDPDAMILVLICHVDLREDFTDVLSTNTLPVGKTPLGNDGVEPSSTSRNERRCETDNTVVGLRFNVRESTFLFMAFAAAGDDDALDEEFVNLSLDASMMDGVRLSRESPSNRPRSSLQLPKLVLMEAGGDEGVLLYSSGGDGLPSREVPLPPFRDLPDLWAVHDVVCCLGAPQELPGFEEQFPRVQLHFSPTAATNCAKSHYELHSTQRATEMAYPVSNYQVTRLQSLEMPSPHRSLTVTTTTTTGSGDAESSHRPTPFMVILLKSASLVTNSGATMDDILLRCSLSANNCGYDVCELVAEGAASSRSVGGSATIDGPTSAELSFRGASLQGIVLSRKPQLTTGTEPRARGAEVVAKNENSVRENNHRCLLLSHAYCDNYFVSKTLLIEVANEGSAQFPMIQFDDETQSSSSPNTKSNSLPRLGDVEVHGELRQWGTLCGAIKAVLRYEIVELLQN